MLCKIKTLPFFKVKRMVERAEKKAQVLIFESAVAVLFEKQDTHLVGQKKKGVCFKPTVSPDHIFRSEENRRPNAASQLAFFYLLTA